VATILKVYPLTLYSMYARVHSSHLRTVCYPYRSSMGVPSIWKFPTQSGSGWHRNSVRWKSRKWWNMDWRIHPCLFPVRNHPVEPPDWVLSGALHT